MAARLGGGAAVGAGLVIELGSLFARTIILARLLGAQEFGIAAAINTLGAVVEMISFLGLDRYLVFAVAGGGAPALAASHVLTLVRGGICALVTLALAWPVARLVGAGQFGWQFALLALVPLLRGFIHLGVYQMQRAHDFVPAAAAEAIGAMVGLVVSAAAAWVRPDHAAIVWGLIAQAATAVFITHVASRARRYRLCFAPAPLRDALRFGLPLAWNGAVLAASNQLDRMVVAGWLGAAALGVYGLATTLLMQPINLLMRFATTTWQPGLSAAWHGRQGTAFATLAGGLGAAASAAGGAAACVIACLGAPALIWVFGPSYAAGDVFCALFAGTIGLRLLRGAMNLFGLAAGATADLALCNSAGVACLPLMALALALRPGMPAAAAGGLAAELLAVAFTHLRLRRHYGRACDRGLRTATISGVILAALAAWLIAAQPAVPARAVVAVLAAAVIAAPVAWRQLGLHQRGMAAAPASNLIQS